MEEKVLEIINYIRSSKQLLPLTVLNSDDNLRDQIEFTSFDLAELTVRIEDEFDIDIFEDGLVITIGEIYEKLRK
jgi:acyl carrier protein